MMRTARWSWRSIRNVDLEKRQKQIISSMGIVLGFGVIRLLKLDLYLSAWIENAICCITLSLDCLSFIDAQKKPCLRIIRNAKGSAQRS
jgi:hypothetical protein